MPRFLGNAMCPLDNAPPALGAHHPDRGGVRNHPTKGERAPSAQVSTAPAASNRRPTRCRVAHPHPYVHDRCDDGRTDGGTRTPMNVSISAVVRDLGTTVSGVQSAIALEALVSAAFILIGSKIGDLIGRKRAYVLGLLAYAVGALAMALAQGLTAIIIFWAIVGGLGASLLLPAMQSLIHGNFEGEDQKKAYALVGAAAAIAAAVGPLLGGFLTTYLSWRVGFLCEVVVIAVVLANLKLIKDVPYTGPRDVDVVGA